MRNHGNFVVSLGDVTRWLGAKVEEQGAYVLAATPAVDVVMDGARIAGVITGDKGIDKHGEKKANYEPGSELRARVTVFGEGPRGTLQKRLGASLGLDRARSSPDLRHGREGVWSCRRSPEGPRRPHDGSCSTPHPAARMYGWTQSCRSGSSSARLPPPDARPPEELQFRPPVARRAARRAAGSVTARRPPVGGSAMPEAVTDGAIFVGDSAGYLNAARLKGIHLAMKSGMLAAETIFDGLVKNDLSAAQLGTYRERFKASWAHRELWAGRNFHQGFDGGLWAGMAFAGIQTVTGGCPRRQDARRPRAHAEARGARRPQRRAKKFAGPTSSLLRPLSLRDDPRGGPAAPPRDQARGRDDDLQRPLQARVRQSVPALLPGQRLRDGARLDRGRHATAPQRQQLRPLQDL
jgi:electron-transferring-flavoprotein dehydrogenase